MRKLLVALMIVACAATAFAEVTVSGYYNVNGVYEQNLAKVDKNTDDQNMYYEHEFKLWVNAQTDKDTYFKSKFEITDKTWATSGAAETYGTETTGTGSNNGIQLERAWMGHNFGILTLDVGIMSGGGWGYAFGDNVEGKYRVKATIPAGPGKIVTYLEKSKENNNEGTDRKDADKDDKDSYALGYSGKFGGFTVAPLVVYTEDGNVDATDGDVDNTSLLFDLALGGSFGPIGFEAEYKTAKTDVEVGEDYTVWGAYGNIYGKVANTTIGFLSAYSSYDKDTKKAFDMADDFDDNFGFVLGEKGMLANVQSQYGVTAGSYSGLAAVWINGLYANYDITEKLNVNGGVIYAMSTVDDDDTTAYEADIVFNYAITKALTYQVMFGYAEIDLDGGPDPDASMLLQHGLTLSF